VKFIKYFVKIGLERVGTTDTNRQQSQVVKLFLLTRKGR